MMNSPSPARSPRSGLPAHTVSSAAWLLTLVLFVSACSDGGVLEPGSTSPSLVGRVNADVVETPSYSAFDTRSQFNGAGTIAQTGDFEGFNGGLVYPQPTPWTSNGVTYTSELNIILGPGIGLGVASNSISTEFGTPLTGQLAATDAFTLFGADLAILGEKVPIGLVVTTNVASYSFADLDVPLATVGRRFFGIALTQPGEVLTGFRFTNANTGATLVMDNVAVGHLADVNTEPVASVGGPYAGAEGASIALSLSGSDDDSDPLTFSWDLGDGTTGSGSTPPASHVYADNGSYDIVLAIDDGRGGLDTAKTTVSVSNVAPSVAAFAVPTAPVPLAAGMATVSVSAAFTDPGSDTHVAMLDCGTGFSAQSSAPNGTTGGTCTYSSAGVYAVQLTVVDDDGDSDSEVATGQVVVYDASGGWVTGGGWIDSPAGAYAPNASVSGKLTFGFVARYQSSSVSIPNGNAEFRLNLAKLDFRSATLDWLVVTGSVSHLQGSGTLNGTGSYGFSLIARDGSPVDGVRIRIWDRMTGLVVYDNQPGSPVESEDVTPLGGGSVQVHSR